MQLTNEVDSPIYSTKFIARECWFAAGGSDGSVLVYDYATKAGIKKFQADHNGKRVNRLAVHPTDPLLLTASTYDESIKVWDWGQGWTCTRVFDARAVSNPWYMAVHPRDTKSIPNEHGSDVKVCICLPLCFSNHQNYTLVEKLCIINNDHATHYLSYMK